MRGPGLTVAVGVLAGLSLVSRSSAYQASSQQPQSESGTGAISGVVIDAITGLPVADAIVSISGRASPVTSQFNRQVTDNRGRFVFTALAASSGYILGADKYGYFPGWFGREQPYDPIRRVALRDGEWRDDITIRLFRPSVLSGTVLDEAGEPVVGVYVQALVRVHIAGQMQFVEGALTTTDDRGMFRLAELAAAEYLVRVPSVQWAAPADTSVYDLSGLTPDNMAIAAAAGRPLPTRGEPAVPAAAGQRLFLGPFPTPPVVAGGRPHVYPLTYYPGARAPEEATLVRLAPGEERSGLTIALSPVPAAHVSGRVIGSPEALEKLVLRLVPLAGEDTGSGSEAATVLVSPGGVFTFINVPRGSYAILANRSQSGWAVSGAPFMSMPAPPGARFSSGSSSAVPGGPIGLSYRTQTMSGEAWFGRGQVEVLDRDVTDLEVVMHRGVSIAGRIIADESPDPRFPPTRSIAAEPAGGEAALGQPWTFVGRNDPTMSFRIEGLMAGEYFLRPRGAIVKSVIWNGRDFTHAPFDASLGRDFEGVVVTTTTHGGRLTGTVRDPSSPEVPAAVICFPVDRAGWRRYGIRSPRIRSTVASTAGEYSIASLPAGEYLVIAVRDTLQDAWVDPAFLVRAAALASRVTVDWGSIVTQHLDLKDVPR